MNNKQISEILSSPAWDLAKLDEAARGLVIGSCDDPPEVTLKFWIEMARFEALRDNLPIEPALKKLESQARRGVFG